MNKIELVKLTWEEITNRPYLLGDVYNKLTQNRVPFNKPQSPPVQVPGECLSWTGSGKTKKYGVFTLQRISEYGNIKFERDAHIVAWMIDNCREPNSKLEIGHLCGNSKCINEKHLAEMTHSQNMRLAAMFRKNPPPGNHAWKVPFSDLIHIHKMFYELKWTRRQIHYQFRFQYSYDTICKIIKGSSYTDNHKKYMETFEQWQS